MRLVLPILICKFPRPNEEMKRIIFKGRSSVLVLLGLSRSTSARRQWTNSTGVLHKCNRIVPRIRLIWIILNFVKLFPIIRSACRTWFKLSVWVFFPPTQRSTCSTIFAIPRGVVARSIFKSSNIFQRLDQYHVELLNVTMPMFICPRRSATHHFPN